MNCHKPKSSDQFDNNRTIAPLMTTTTTQSSITSKVVKKPKKCWPSAAQPSNSSKQSHSTSLGSNQAITSLAKVASIPSISPAEAFIHSSILHNSYSHSSHTSSSHSTQSSSPFCIYSPNSKTADSSVHSSHSFFRAPVLTKNSGPSGQILNKDNAETKKKGFFRRLFSSGSEREHNSHTNRVVIAEDSVVITDRHLFDEINAKRQKTMNDLFESKRVKKVITNGETRYVPKHRPHKPETSILSRVKSWFGIKSRGQKQRNRLAAQFGREDSTLKEVNKTIERQPTTSMCEPLRNPFDIITTLKAGTGHRWPSDPIGCHSQVRQLSLARIHCSLKASILYDQTIQELARIDCEFLYGLNFAMRKSRPSQSVRQEMCRRFRSAFLMKNYHFFTDLQVSQSRSERQGIVATKRLVTQNSISLSKELCLLGDLKNNNVVFGSDFISKVIRTELVFDLKSFLSSRFIATNRCQAMQVVKGHDIHSYCGDRHLHYMSLIQWMSNIIIVIGTNLRVWPKISDLDLSKRFEDNLSNGTALICPTESFETQLMSALEEIFNKYIRADKEHEKRYQMIGLKPESKVKPVFRDKTQSLTDSSLIFWTASLDTEFMTALDEIFSENIKAIAKPDKELQQTYQELSSEPEFIPKSKPKLESQSPSTQLNVEEVFGGLNDPEVKKLTEHDRNIMIETLMRTAQQFKEKDIFLEKFLGKGGQAFIFSTKTNRIHKRKLAVKLHIKENDKNFAKELKLLRQLSHKNVIQSIDLGTNVMAMEFAEGDLSSVMRKSWIKDQTIFSMEWSRMVCTDILRGLEYLHSRYLVHNDIKLINILIVYESIGWWRTRMVAKITDFGMTDKVMKEENGKEKRRKLRLSYGTPSYAPPECLEKKLLNDARLSDVWAFGVVVHYLITYHSLFPRFKKEDRHDPNLLKQRIKTLKRSHKLVDSSQFPNTEDISDEDREEVRALLKRLLNPDVSSRESIQTIAYDQWFQTKKRSDSYAKNRKLKTRTNGCLL